MASGRECDLNKPVFFPHEAYTESRQGYRILPFRFLQFDKTRKILVNDVGEYLFLDDETFRAFVSHRLDPDNETYLDFKSKHFLLDHPSPAAFELLATKYRTKKAFLKGFTKLHIFVVTLRCDHSCHYCQVSRVSLDRQKYDMSEQTAAKAIDLMFQSPGRELKVEFQGGEPLVNFDLIRWIVETVKSKNASIGKDIQFVVATNLSHLTDEILAFFKQHGVFLSISLDGPEFLHNANRPRPGGNSYQVTVSGIRRAREVLGHDRVAALMTTTRLSLSYPREIVDEYVAQGFDSIFLRPLSPYGFAVKAQRKLGYSMKEFLAFYRSAFEYILELNRRGMFLVEVYAQILLTKILTPFPTYYVNLQSPSGDGIGVAVYNYDGWVYPSDEARMLAETGDFEFRLGNVHVDSYREIFGGPKLRSIVLASCNESLPGCADCAFQPFCGSDPVFNYATQGDIFGHRPTSEFCEKNMAIIKLLLDIIESGDSLMQDILWSWIHNRRINSALPLLEGALDRQ